jgi:hypothetical protein
MISFQFEFNFFRREENADRRAENDGDIVYIDEEDEEVEEGEEDEEDEDDEIIDEPDDFYNFL